MARIATNVSELIGSTPLVRINRVAGDNVDVVAKIESFNPGSSVKDRIAAAIIDAAEQSGQLRAGGTIVEASSGNTGVALAMVGASRGYKVVIVMPSSMSIERRIILRALGAEVVLTDPKGGVAAAVTEAQRILAERPGSVAASQFSNPANPAIHETTTAEEIWADTDGHVDVFVAGVGTGGTISGVAKILKERNPNVRIIAVQPAESPLLSGGQAGPHGIQGLMPNFIPDTYNGSLVDEVISIESRTALEFARLAAREEGLLVGISSGAALAAAREVAARPEFAGLRIVTLLPDTGERYLSTALFEDLRDPAQ